MSEEKTVQGQVVERQPEEASKTFFHPLSGVVILGLDWLAFGGDLATDFFGTPFIAIATFAVTFAAVHYIQTRWHGDPPRMARMKALFGALAAGIPLPITGTIFGTAILLLSGLHRRK